MLYKLSLVNILENVFVFIEILFKMLLFKGGVHIYAEHCIYNAVSSDVAQRSFNKCTAKQMSFESGFKCG